MECGSLLIAGAACNPIALMAFVLDREHVTAIRDGFGGGTPYSRAQYQLGESVGAVPGARRS